MSGDDFTGYLTKEIRRRFDNMNIQGEIDRRDTIHDLSMREMECYRDDENIEINFTREVNSVHEYFMSTHKWQFCAEGMSKYGIPENSYYLDIKTKFIRPRKVHEIFKQMEIKNGKIYRVNLAFKDGYYTTTYVWMNES